MFSTGADRALTLAATLLCCWNAAAATLPDDSFHALPCRPTIACTADLIPPGGIEIEGGYLVRRLGGGVLQHSTPWLLKLTLAEWVQLQIGSNGGIFAGTPQAPSARYLDDVTVGLKLHLQDQDDAAPALSFSATLSAPTLGGQLGYLYTYDLLFALYVSKDFRWLHVDLNAGADLWRIEAAPASTRQPLVKLREESRSLREESRSLREESRSAREAT